MIRGGQDTISNENVCNDIRTLLMTCKFSLREATGAATCSLRGGLLCTAPNDPYACEYIDKDLYKFINTLRVLHNTVEAMYDHYCNEMADEIKERTDGTK